jgi:hypothetical protein
MVLPCYRTISSTNNRVTFVTARGPIQGLNGAITSTSANHRIVGARIRDEAAEDLRARRTTISDAAGENRWACYYRSSATP